MPPADQDEAGADARFIEWMHHNLSRAAEQFRLAITGEPVLGWRLRTIGAPASGAEGPRWLRVVSEFTEWAGGDSWTGNTDANAITAIPKPRVLDVFEWQEADWRSQRAEVLTLLPGRSIAPTDLLDQVVDLPDSWWEHLRRSVDALGAVPTERVHTD